MPQFCLFWKGMVVIQFQFQLFQLFNFIRFRTGIRRDAQAAAVRWFLLQGARFIFIDHSWNQNQVYQHEIPAENLCYT